MLVLFYWREPPGSFRAYESKRLWVQVVRTFMQIVCRNSFFFKRDPSNKQNSGFKNEFYVTGSPF
jgi:hypothetical protein